MSLVSGKKARTTALFCVAVLASTYSSSAYVCVLPLGLKRLCYRSLTCAADFLYTGSAEGIWYERAHGLRWRSVLVSVTW